MQWENRFNILDYLIIVFRRKWLILRWVLGMTVLFYALSYGLPKYYKAKTSVLPPAERSSSRYLQAFSQIQLAGIFPSANTQQTKIFLQMLRSRTLKERLIRQFDLQKRWHQKSLEKTLRQLAAQTDMMDTRDGMIILQVKARSPKMAADLANYYIQELDRLNRQKMVSRARSARIYIAHQLDSTRISLRKASEALASFQESHKTINLPEQIKQAIKQAGELKAKIIIKRVQLQVLRKSMKQDNPGLQLLRSEITALNQQYEKIQFGGDQPLISRKEFFVAFSEAPEIGLQLAELTRNVRVLETVFQLLNQQYYQAKIEEARDTPTVQILDRAEPPEHKYWPSRLLIALTGGFITFFVLVFGLWFQQYFKDLQTINPEEFQRWENLKKALRLTRSPGRKKQS
ncbi:chain length determinant protein [bacterium BMS3Abin05]|nr:chain length determinant protein [bacterium BMS3Abin05]GBE27028.1 chain length determinant protein [bacterium BMS3Bbin03]